MKSLLKELQALTETAKIRKKPLAKKAKKEISPEVRASHFLRGVPNRLRSTARQGGEGMVVLRLFNQIAGASMDTFEALVFKGCKTLGLRPSLTECYETEMGERESIGMCIYVCWEK